MCIYFQGAGNKAQVVMHVPKIKDLSAPYNRCFKKIS